ncbi:MAG: DUF3175 domain-containing protein [Xanthobacteraceae bacterium]
MKGTGRAASNARPSGTANSVSVRTVRTQAPRRWSQRVTEHSNALDLEQGVFTLKDPKQIAASLKRSAQASKRRKADPFRSALSMMTFYINRSGANLGAAQRRTLMRAKDELRKQFGRA